MGINIKPGVYMKEVDHVSIGHKIDFYDLSENKNELKIYFTLPFIDSSGNVFDKQTHYYKPQDMFTKVQKIIFKLLLFRNSMIKMNILLRFV